MSERPLLVNCPDCHGASIIDLDKCRYCSGRGIVTETQASWKWRGADMQCCRESISANLHETADYLGLKPNRQPYTAADVALMEAGLADPSPLENHWLRGVA